MSPDQEPQAPARPGPPPSTAIPPEPEPEPDLEPELERTGRGGARTATGTRTSHTWVALAAGLFFLIVVLVFILQNLKSVKVRFFWATWSIPLGVDLLLAAVLGGLIMFATGSLRIAQLRRATRRRSPAGDPRRP